MSVRLPAPFGPIRAMASPGSTRPVTPSSTGSRPYDAATSCNESAGPSAKVLNDDLRVVTLHLQIGVAVATRRTERVAEQRAVAFDDLHAGLRRDGRRGLRREGRFGEHRLHTLGPDLVDQVGDVAARQLR